MKKNPLGFAVIAIAAMLVACGMDGASTPAESEKPERTVEAPATPTSMQGATCATLPTDVEFGSWKHRSTTHNCLRRLAYKDWPKARAEAAHILTWNIANADLGELIDTLSNYESADAVAEVMRAYGLLDGDGEQETIEYYDEDWEPLTGSDWLLKAGNQFGFDAETGMHPNHHDSLLYDLAALFGDKFADATFAETAPHWESEEPYQLHATLGDQEWNRQAANYGDWYDVSAVLDLINEMAADIDSPNRIIALETGDQTVTVIVGPGQSLVAAAADGLIRPAGADASMQRGKAFEEEFLRRYRIVAE